MLAAKSAKATGDLRDAVMRAWPAVIAVMGEVNPRDTTMQAEFINIGVDAFDPQHAGSDMVEHLVKPVFKETQTQYARYLVHGGREPITWKEVAEEIAEEAMKGFVLRSMLAAKAAPAVPDKPLYGQPDKPQLQQTARRLRSSSSGRRR